MRMLSAIASDLVVAKWANGQFRAINPTIYIPDDDEILDGTKNVPKICLAIKKEGEKPSTAICLECHKTEHGLLSILCGSLKNEHFAKLQLQTGKNVAKLTFMESGKSGKAALEIDMNIFLWDEADKLIISDIDGTITRSDKRGLLLPMIGINWAQSGVVELYSALAKNGYKLAYLSSRPIPLLEETAEYIRELKLPDGPIFLTPQGLKTTIRNLDSVLKPVPFKKSVLKAIKDIFPPKMEPFFAGIGNQATDIEVYQAQNLSPFYIVDEAGAVLKYEKGQKAVKSTSYVEMLAEVDKLFPKIKDDHHCHKCTEV